MSNIIRIVVESGGRSPESSEGKPLLRIEVPLEHLQQLKVYDRDNQGRNLYIVGGKLYVAAGSEVVKGKNWSVPVIPYIQ